MTTLRTTAIMKTDLSGSTARFRTLPEPDLTALLAGHRALLERISAMHEGHVVKPEGDGYWIAFPSVRPVRRALAGPAWDARLRRVDVTLGGRLADLEIHRLDPRIGP